MAGWVQARVGKEAAMRFAPRPNISVEIGNELRVYAVHVTTAHPAFDGPSTVTLYTSTLTNLSGYALDPIVHDVAIGTSPARIVLIESKEYGWHEKKYQEGHCVFRPADPRLFNLSELQTVLWRRLRAPAATEVHS
jgi:hypothetical protein